MICLIMKQFREYRMRFDSKHLPLILLLSFWFSSIGLSDVWMLMKCWIFENENENSIKASSVKLSKKSSSSVPLYQLLFEQSFVEFISVTITCVYYLWEDCFWNAIDGNEKLTWKIFNNELPECVQAKYLHYSRTAVKS